MENLREKLRPGSSTSFKLSMVVGAGSMLFALPALAKPCAEFSFTSAEKCEDIQAKLDVSGCQDQLVSGPKIKCSEGKARLEFLAKRTAI